MRTADLFAFIRERHAIYRARQQGKPRPWTKDEILQSYRFCNVYRELDTETQWIAQNWRVPYASHPDLWFAMMMARLFNWHETLAELGFPEDFNAAYVKDMRRALARRIAMGQKVWTGAYMVSTNGRAVDFKHDYVIECVLKPAWKARERVRPQEGDTLQSFYERLLPLEGMGRFMAGQVIADTKYEGVLHNAEDWWTWAVMGPGSKRGMNRVMGRERRQSLSEKKWRAEMDVLVPALNKLVSKSAVFEYDTLHAQDIQNCLCEFDKYERVRLGQGRPRARYNGRGE